MPHKDDQFHQGRTDWARLASMSEAEKRAIAEADDENPKWTRVGIEEAELVVPGEGSRIPVSIRLSARVIAWFKRQGPGYQTRINQVLLDYVNEEARKREPQIDWKIAEQKMKVWRSRGDIWDASGEQESVTRSHIPEYA